MSKKPNKKIRLTQREAYFLEQAERDPDVSLFCGGRRKNRLIMKSESNSFCIYNHEHRGDFLRFCNSIAKCLSRYDVKLHLDFSDLNYLSAAASVFLFAEITRWQLGMGSDVINYSLPTDKDLRAYFRLSGLHEAITPGELKKLEKISRNRSPYSSATDFDHHIYYTLQTIMTKELLPSDLEHFQRGLQEAVLNVKHHAYAQQQPSFGSRWWQLCYHDTRNKKIHVIVHDRGIGIARSLRASIQKKNSLLYMSQPRMMTESEIIDQAMKLGISRYTSNENRGKGSDDLKRPVDEISNGVTTLAIWSGKGEWVYRNNSAEFSDIDASLNGTLLEWVYKYDSGDTENAN